MITFSLVQLGTETLHQTCKFCFRAHEAVHHCQIPTGISIKKEGRRGPKECERKTKILVLESWLTYLHLIYSTLC